MLRINVIGAGRLGQSLAWLLHHHHLANVQAVVCRTLPAAIRAVSAIGGGTPATLEDTLPPAEITWITTPDSQIQAVCQQLVKQQRMLRGSTVIHSSGAHPSQWLQAARKLDCAIASVHPMKSFMKPSQAEPTLAGVYWGAEGDPAALATITPLLEALGAHVVTIHAETKPLYHAAAVFASNFLPLLYELATRCFHRAALDNNAAHHSTLALMQSALTNLTSLRSASQALTGPIQRGDTDVMQQHLRALIEDLPTLAPLYQQLSAATATLLGDPTQTEDLLAALGTPLTDDIA